MEYNINGCTATYIAGAQVQSVAPNEEQGIYRQVATVLLSWERPLPSATLIFEDRTHMLATCAFLHNIKTPMDSLLKVNPLQLPR